MNANGQPTNKRAMPLTRSPKSSYICLIIPDRLPLVTHQFDQLERRNSMMRVVPTFVALLVAGAIVGAKGSVAGGGQTGQGKTGTSSVEYMQKYAAPTQIVRGCLKPPATGSLYS